MGLADVYEVWDAWEYNQVDMLYSILRVIKDDLVPVDDMIMGGLQENIVKVGGFIWDLADDIKTAIGSLVDTVKHGLGGILDGVVKPVWEAIKQVYSYIESGYKFIGDSIAGAVAVLSTELGAFSGKIGGWIKSAASDVWGWIKDISGTVYKALSDAISKCWDYFIKVVIPFIYDMLVRVYESPEVQKAIEYVTKQLKALFDWLFTIDTAEMEKWARKTSEFIRTLVLAEGAV